MRPGDSGPDDGTNNTGRIMQRIVGPEQERVPPVSVMSTGSAVQ